MEKTMERVITEQILMDYQEYLYEEENAFYIFYYSDLSNALHKMEILFKKFPA